MMDTTIIEKIKARIAELEQERQKLVDDLNEQANALLNPYNSALAELKKLLPPEEDEESPIQEE